MTSNSQPLNGPLSLGQSKAPRPYDLLIGGFKRESLQWAMLGTEMVQKKTIGGGHGGDAKPRTIAVDLDNLNTWFLMGVQGSGKSYTLQLIAESCSREVRGLNALPAPPTVIGIHYTEELSYKHEALHMRYPNQDSDQVKRLRDEYQANAIGHSDIVVVTPRNMVAARKAEMAAQALPGEEPVPVEPLVFGMKQIGIREMQILMGALGDADSEYVQVINTILERNDGHVTMDLLRSEVTASLLSETDKRTALNRIDFMSRFVSDDGDIGRVLKPGRYISVDLRDPTLLETSAFRLIIVLMRMFCQAKTEHGTLFPKVFVLDEFHVYARNKTLVEALERTVRMMRHYSSSVVMASQDPMLVDPCLLELASIIISNKIISPRWKAHVASVNPAFGNENLMIGDLFSLRPGEGVVWTRACYDPDVPLRPIKIKFRPSFTSPGGVSRTATSQLKPGISNAPVASPAASAPPAP